jgi:hypothetical protein
MNEQAPPWDTSDPTGSLKRYAGFLRDAARTMFLEAGSHLH